MQLLRLGVFVQSGDNFFLSHKKGHDKLLQKTSNWWVGYAQCGVCNDNDVCFQCVCVLWLNISEVLDTAKGRG